MAPSARPLRIKHDCQCVRHTAGPRRARRWDRGSETKDRPRRPTETRRSGFSEWGERRTDRVLDPAVRSGGTRAWREGQRSLRSQNETTRNPTPPPIAGMVRSLSLPPSARPPRRSLRPDCNRGHSAPPAPPVSVVGHDKKRAAVSPPKGRSFEKNGERGRRGRRRRHTADERRQRESERGPDSAD